MVLQKFQKLFKMKRRIEKYIPLAINIVKDVKIADEQGRVKNEFQGYFSSLGASIIQSGLIPAMAFFSNENSEASKDRAKILKAIYSLIAPENKNHKDPNALLFYVIENKNNESLAPKIIDASIALKLAVRTYKLAK